MRKLIANGKELVIITDFLFCLLNNSYLSCRPLPLARTKGLEGKEGILKG